MTMRLSPLVAGGSFAHRTFKVLIDTSQGYFRIDGWIGAVLVLFALIYVPGITRATDNPQMLAAFVNDEPWLSMALDATLAKPYGNPSNYFDPTRKTYAEVPSYWGHLRYPGITYYGGALFAAATPIYAAARALHLPPFPTAPIILRAITALAGGLSLIVLYNIARLAKLARPSGVLAAVYMIGNVDFFYYSSFAHPDTLQLLFALLALAVAAKHSKHGDLPSLAALGILCGFVQGSKVGGPWTVPMALLSLLWGYRAMGYVVGDWRRSLARLALLAVSALFGYFLTSPYAFLDPYLFRSFVSQWGIVGLASDRPFGTITLADWMSTIYTQIGPIATVLVVASLARTAVLTLTGRCDKILMLGAVMAVSQLIWFSLLGKLWVVPGYMIAGFAVMAALSFDVLFTTGRRAVEAVGGRRRRFCAATVPITSGVILVFTALSIASQIANVANYALTNMLYRSSTYFALDDWATRALPHSTKIMFDDLAYLDPKVFPNAKMNGGILTWPQVASSSPEYIILSSSLYDAPLIANLRRTQHLSEYDSDQYSVRLYQDLLKGDTLEETGVHGVDLVKIIAAAPVKVTPPKWTYREGGGPVGWVLARIWQTDYHIRQAASEFMALVSTSPRVPISGYTLRVYRLSPPGGPNAGRAFASSQREDYPARYAFDGTSAAWNAEGSSKVFAGEFIGYDFGEQNPGALTGLEIQWIYGAVTPHAILVEYSDDRVSWTRAGRFTIADYPAADRPIRRDKFLIGEKLAHRYWRVVDDDTAAAAGFGVTEVGFLMR